MSVDRPDLELKYENEYRYSLEENDKIECGINLIKRIDSVVHREGEEIYKKRIGDYKENLNDYGANRESIHQSSVAVVFETFDIGDLFSDCFFD